MKSEYLSLSLLGRADEVSRIEALFGATRIDAIGTGQRVWNVRSSVAVGE
jgi:hypothetical protein